MGEVMPDRDQIRQTYNIDAHDHLINISPYKDPYGHRIVALIEVPILHEHEGGSEPHTHPEWFIDYVELYDHPKTGIHEMDVVPVRGDK